MREDTMMTLIALVLTAWLQPQAADPPVIQQLYDASKSVLSCMSPGQKFVARGRHFRDTQGTWRLAFGGHGIGSDIRVTAWSNTLIEAVFPERPPLEPGKAYYIAIREANGAWVSSLTAMFTPCPAGEPVP